MMNKAGILCTMLLFLIGCSESDPSTAPQDPASLSMVLFPSTGYQAVDRYTPGDTITFILTSDVHNLKEEGGKVCAEGVPVIDFDRIDSTRYEHEVGMYVDYKTPLAYEATLSANRRVIRCTFPDIPAESLSPANMHQWFLHLSLANGNPLSDRYGGFYMKQNGK